MLLILVTNAAVFLTGHKIGSFDLCWAMRSNFTAFFCSSNVILTNFAWKMDGLSCGIITSLSVENCIFFKLMVFVFRSDAAVVYSQDRQAKKKAMIASCPIARCSDDRQPRWWSWRKKYGGSTFCCFTGGSWFLYPLNCSSNPKSKDPDASTVGSVLPLALKISPNSLMVSRTVDAARWFLCSKLKWPSLTAWANPPMMVGHHSVLIESRNTSSSSSIRAKNLFHISYALLYFWSDEGVLAAALAASLEWMRWRM